MNTYTLLRTTLSSFLMSFFSLCSLSAQCPDTASLATNGNCVDTDGQITGVDEITIDGTTYTWDAGSGFYTTGSSNGCNNLPVFSGTMTLEDGTECDYVDGVLPVTWGTFTLKKENNFIDINWSTYLEINNDRFQIEESDDGYNFYEIGSIGSVGNSYDLQEYSFTYFPQKTGLHFYRIKQVDLNGQFSYSNIESLFIDKNENKEVIIFPNPARDILNIENVTGPWNITNLVGQTINQGTNYRIDIKDLDFGIYFFGYIEAGRNKSIKFIKS